MNAAKETQMPEDPEQMEGRLDALERRIQDTRRQAEDDGLLPDDDEPTFIQPNPRVEPEDDPMDDPTIAPPG